MEADRLILSAKMYVTMVSREGDYGLEADELEFFFRAENKDVLDFIHKQLIQTVDMFMKKPESSPRLVEHIFRLNSLIKDINWLKSNW